MKVMHNSSRKKGYIDIHCHMLPAVDDGSASMEESLRMAKFRSEERRVGKECRSRWSPYH